MALMDVFTHFSIIRRERRGIRPEEIKNTTDELQQAADQFRLANKLHNAKDTWNWLEKQGLSLDDFEEIVQFSLLSGKLAEHLFADKIESYFVEHQLDYTGAVIYEVV
jgi:hypothetical protein